MEQMDSDIEQQEQPLQEQQQKSIAQQRKELRAQIQAIKKSTANMNKKDKKAAMEQVHDLEKKIQQLENQKDSEQQQTVSSQQSNSAVLPESLYKNSDKAGNNLEGGEQKKLSKQQLRKLKKQAEIERIRQDAINEPTVDLAQIERQKIDQLIQSDGLSILEVAPDGNCLFRSIQDQIGNQYNHEELRRMAVEYIREHRDDFAPFVQDDNGDLADFEQYCSDMADVNRAKWGGEVEIRALAHALKRDFVIYQAEFGILRVRHNENDTGYGGSNPTSTDDDNSIRISYHKHEYGLGEHYNSLRRVNTN
ncbi:hypothetical protein MP228_007947 [Amoeboaphelidium protococcarum]|nr:hypothetical protein MP228_007947 [Amoeboaphelidium protococcarum]